MDKDEEDINSTLKELNDLDAEEFSKNKFKDDSEKKSSLSKMSKESLDDFDVDDDNLDDLLNDEDDESFTNKKNTPKKILSPPKSPPKSNKMSESMKKIFQLDSSPEESPEVEKKIQKSPTKSQSPSKIISKTPIKSEKQKSSLESESNIPPPSKTSTNKLDLFMEEESKYLDELGVNKLEKKSPVKTTANVTEKIPKKNQLKRNDSEFSDSEDDILDALDKAPITTTSPKKTRSSFLDDLFGNSKETKKSLPKDFSSLLQNKYKKTDKIDKKEKVEEEEDVFGGYVPSSSTKSSSARRKSVKFEDKILKEPQNESILPNRSQSNSPKKGSSDKNNNDDDWLGFLRKDSKNESMQGMGKLEEKNESSHARRKSSSADWLGLNESPLSSPKSSSKIQSPSHQDNKGSGNRSEQLISKKQLPWHPSPSNTTSSGDNQASIQNSPIKQQYVTNNPIEKENVTNTKTVQSPSVPGNFPASPNMIPITHVPQTPVPPVIPQSYSVPSFPPSYGNTDATFQTMIATLQFEKDHLLKTVEEMRKRQDEELRTFQNALENQKKGFEETFDYKLQNIKTEHESSLQVLKHQLQSFENEKKQALKENQMKFENIEKEYKQQLEKLKELHNDAILLMKKDHEEALSRLRELKDREIEAITSTEIHSRSLQSLTDQLGQRTSELADLQVKVNDKHQTAIQEKQAALKAKEQELKALENRLHWQMEEGDQERTRLQQLVLRLESRLQQITKEGEEDRWSMQQAKAKLEVHQKYLEEEKKSYLEFTEREKEKFRKSQESLLQEQKTIFQHIAVERQQLTTEKHELESLARQVKNEESTFNIRKMKEQSILEGQRLALQYEDEKLRHEKELAKQESQQLFNERQLLNREKQRVNEEREKIEDTKMLLKRKSDEIEAISLKATLDKEEAKSMFSMAKKIEASHQTKIDHVTQQLQLITEKERDLVEEKEQLLKLKQELSEKRSSMLCAKCKLAVGLPITELPPNFSQHLPIPTTVGYNVPTVANFQTHPAYPYLLDPSLMVWHLTGQKDREFLENEHNFLRSLKEGQKKLDDENS